MSPSIFQISVILVGIFLATSVKAAKKNDRNTTSISTDGGCRLSVNDIIFTRVDPSTGKKGLKTVVYVDFAHLINDSTTPDPPCGNNSGIIKLDFEGISDKLEYFNLTFSIEHQRKYGWWQVNWLHLVAVGDMITADSHTLEANWTGAVMESVGMGASDKFSYACSQPNELMVSNKGENQPIYKLQFMNLHLQPFSYTKKSRNNGFTDNVDDCIAFFSASVWMALLTLLIFVLIILSGVVMLSNMTTVNRFDDPKGKQLVIMSKE